jgi:tetratricopeptide (TPR) repeat protein
LKNLFFILLPLLSLLFSCSSERNTWTSKAYHNTTAHYNGYWYANEEIRKIEDVIYKAQVDDYNRILRLFPTFDTTLAKSYDKEVQEAVKMASIAIQRHPNSRWVDDAYILVGKARLYSLDWANAIQTFKHVNTKSKNKDARHLAIINLVRTYIEHQEFANAQAAIDYLAKAKLNRYNQKKFNLEKAYYYQLQQDYDNMVRNLTAADPLLKKKDKRGRIYFIIGQVYQKLGFEAEAYNYYKKCIGTNPEYEVDFYARLYMAQVTEISKSRDIYAARKSFRRLLRDQKNKEFQDKIHYEMGIFELKQKNLNEAIENFNASVRKGNNTRIDGEAFLRLGEIYYDTLRNYPLSQAYYDSAIQTLPKDYEGYAEIKNRQEILNEFVKHLKTIEWQDSLLRLSELDSTTLRANVESVVTARIKEQEKQAAKKKKKSNRVDLSSNANSSIFDTNEGGAGVTDWYFGNPSAMALGQAEFVRVWGNIKLEDDWRRSQRQTNTTAQQNVAATDDPNAKQNDNDEKTAPKVDPVDAEYNRIAKEIPRTDQAKKEALDKIEEAYFKLADIYYFKLHENDNAAATYKKLLARFPDSKFEPEALYTLYLITKETSPEEAEGYATLLKTKHPNSTFAKILINPDYLHESGLAVEKQKSFYKTAYEKFQVRNYIGARDAIEEALDLGETPFVPTLELLNILIVGETENISQYQYELDEFIKKYEKHELAAYAQKLLAASRQFQQQQEKRKGIQYIPSFEEPHYFVIVHKRSEKMDEKASTALEHFNKSSYAEMSLKTSNLILNDDYSITFVADFPDKKAAVDYFKSFIEKRGKMNEFRNHNFHNFVITRDNFDIFYRTKGLDEYLDFFEKNYQTRNP